MTRGGRVMAGAENEKTAIVNIRNIETIPKEEKLTNVREVRIGIQSL
jgi:hypothetical protein